MKKKYEAPSVTTVFFQLKETLMMDGSIEDDEDLGSSESRVEW